MPATLGRLRQYTLHGAVDNIPSTFQLPNHLSHYPPKSGTNSIQETKKLNRKGVPLGQLQVMCKIVKDYKDDFEMQTMLNQDEHLTDEFTFTGPEWLFHGTPVDWDTIYKSGGLTSQGSNTNLDKHVHSSSSAQSCYVSGSRELSVAKSFAKTKDGWIYLFFTLHGIGVHFNGTHKQAEVMSIADVPLRHIFMFKCLQQPELIYENLDFRKELATDQNREKCLRFIGGPNFSQLPSPFWKVV